LFGVRAQENRWARSLTEPLTASSQLKEYLSWPHAEQVFRLERSLVRMSDGQVVEETTYGVTSLTLLSPTWTAAPAAA
jgi:hypothetical protein